MPSRTYLGKPVSAKVAYFSSRGPNSIAQAILKVIAFLELILFTKKIKNVEYNIS